MSPVVVAVSHQSRWLARELDSLGAERVTERQAIELAGNGDIGVVLIGPGPRADLLLRGLRNASSTVAAVVVAADEDQRRTIQRLPGLPPDTQVVPAGTPASAIITAVAHARERVELGASLRATLEAVRAKSERPAMRSDEVAGRADPLTGLLDRSSVLEALARQRSTDPLAVLFVDVDHFKLVNDRYGHSVGDRVLRSVAERLRRAVRPGDLVGRLGGDEFVVVVELRPGGRSAEQIADRIVSSFGEPVRLGSWNLSVTVSIGVAAAGPDADPAVVLGNADAAMYRSKKDGRARYQMHDDIAERERRRRQQLIADLPEALEAGHVRAALEPIFDVSRQVIVGYRSMPVWVSPTEGQVWGNEVREIADRAGLVDPVETSFWQSALHSFQLRNAGLLQGDPGLSIPVRSASLDRSLVARLRDEITQALIAPSQVTIEVPADAVGVFAAERPLAGTGLVAGLSDAGATPLDFSALVDGEVRCVAFAPGLLHHDVGHRVLLSLASAFGALGIRTLGTGVEEPDDLVVLRESRVAYCSGPLLGSSNGLSERVCT